ncbi:MAG: DUF1566 domain-containing protein [Terracidiphilus sp.]
MHSLVKPIWDITGATWVDHPPHSRFAILKTATSPTGDAVLDKETRLVWERSPSINKTNLSAAVVYSTTKVVVDRKGWRLPALEELLSLVDPAETNPTLPNGHPFVNVKLDYFYWSLTRGLPLATGEQNLVWGYNFGNADTSSIVVAVASCYTWLVRGGYGHNYALSI